MKVIYNTPVEVSKEISNILHRQFSGIIAFREESGKHYIKLMIPKYAKLLNQLLSRES